MTDSSPLAQDISKRGFRIGAGLILILALILRVLGAKGDLAQDEITSLDLVAKITRFDQVFWQINNDNNHPLNSAWLYLVGPHASFLAMRAFSIALGVATVWAAGVWGARRSRLAGLMTMGLFATSYLMVNYTSEARGYAGMMLCIVLAVLVLENILSGKRQGFRLGLCVLSGTLFHYDMLLVTGSLALCCFWFVWRQSSDFGKALETTLQSFTWAGVFSCVCLLPIMLFPFSIGYIHAFSFVPFLGAYDLALQTAVNMPAPSGIYIDVMFAILVSLIWFSRHKTDFRALLYLMALVGFPILICLFRIANTNFPRHMIFCGMAYMFMMAEVGAHFWQRGAGARMAVGIVILVILAWNAQLLTKFYADHRGHYSQAVADMMAQGPVTYGMDKPLSKMVDFYSRTMTAPAPVFVPVERWCSAGPPQFLFLIWVQPNAMPQSHVTWGPPGCQAGYDRMQLYPAWGLTGSNWVLFKRD
jgi:hypothetical protein